MTQSVLITGTSSGLGEALAEHYLDQGARVYGLSRRGSPIQHENLFDTQLDLGELEHITPVIEDLLREVGKLDLVILNAGILGEIQPMHTLALRDLKQLMDINVWSNKVILDYLCEGPVDLDQVVAISSGAAVNGNKGWGAYSLSKATLNMLIKLYAAEYGSVHFSSLAPGLVDTRMQDHLCNPDSVDAGEFPSVLKLRQARGTDAMPAPDTAAARIAGALPALKRELNSGDFVDMRNL